jgi:hypothetical protein
MDSPLLRIAESRRIPTNRDSRLGDSAKKGGRTVAVADSRTEAVAVAAAEAGKSSSRINIL